MRPPVWLKSHGCVSNGGETFESVKASRSRNKKAGNYKGVKASTRAGHLAATPKAKAGKQKPARPQVSKVGNINRGGRPRGIPKTGGRKPGTPNRRTFDAMLRLAALDCDPLEGLARLAGNKSVSIRLRACGELMQYVYPKRKAVEFVAPPDGDQVTVTLEELLIRYRQASK